MKKEDAELAALIGFAPLKFGELYSARGIYSLALYFILYHLTEKVTCVIVY